MTKRAPTYREWLIDCIREDAAKLRASKHTCDASQHDMAAMVLGRLFRRCGIAGKQQREMLAPSTPAPAGGRR